jgi:hypothetical protein
MEWKFPNSNKNQLKIFTPMRGDQVGDQPIELNLSVGSNARCPDYLRNSNYHKILGKVIEFFFYWISDTAFSTGR